MMVIEPNKGDWINLLIAERNHHNSWLRADISSIFVILSIFLISINIFGLTLTNIILLPLYLLFIIIMYNMYISVIDVLKTKELINDIFKRKIKSLDEMEERWFKEENLLMKGWIKKFVLTKGFKFSIVLIIVSFILIVLGVASYFLINGLVFLSSSQFITIGFGFVTIAFGILSYRFYLESTQLVSSIVNGQFRELETKFIDRYPNLKYNLPEGVRNTQSWQLLNYFQHGEEIKKSVKPELQRRLIGRFTYFLKILRELKVKRYWKEVKNYMDICEIVLNFRTDDDKVKDDLIKEITKWLGTKESTYSNMRYLELKKEEFKDYGKGDIFC